MPGSEIFTSLKTGAIDATEWVGPYNDIAFGLHKAARYYYYPGWQEPGSALEMIINRAAFDRCRRPARNRADLRSATNDRMAAEFTARNAEALQTLVRDHGVEVRRYPDDVIRELQRLSAEVLEETARTDAMFRRVLDSLQAFRQTMTPYINIAERAMLNTRA